MYRRIIFIIFIFFNLNIFSQQLPQPKNDQLYTEFISSRYASYLKKPLIGSGYIAKDGKDKFIFKQIKPVNLEIKKMNNKVTYKRGTSDPVEISNVDNELFFLFDDPEKTGQFYNIDKKVVNKKDNYYLAPKDKQNISRIIIIGIEDIIERIEIYFSDNSKIIYDFKNTVTGKKPDEKYF